ncbi:hypothetical protein pEaSNUABM13_00056 [Erwinia phage pEa_SNUABM_13]|uniref:Lipoprotein n=1 Tax=Erwinia phage pEa_SNUABM_7 TaxID=2866695 RepID=A0AAE8BP18_9CAUD|nr:hypothetical protein MPK74_gp055 [Erwinia phage pEa_SNUABM_7]QYW03015.1 hypothetical protein pEaSNUABM13_00056 [Erwinia phage pEa_SNUABM_13]QYW04723.1 hypothetical protein pEaSNUABM7_00055 [Erwinia phage pEa_SNUABM_7]
MDTRLRVGLAFIITGALTFMSCRSLDMLFDDALPISLVFGTLVALHEFHYLMSMRDFEN